MDFQPGLGSRINRATAILLGNTFREIRSEGPLTPKAVVDKARPRSSPLHDLFEWNDAVAAESHRLSQAGYYLRSVDVMIVDEDEEAVRVRAVHCEGEAGYDFTTRIMRNPDRRKNLLAQALAEFRVWEARWQTLEELGEVFAAAEKIKSKKKKH